MSADSCTESLEVGSTCSPSRARAASDCFESISSAIFVSIVCAAMIRHAVTGSSCPIRCTRSIAWVCSAAVHDSSASTTFEAACMLTPTPAAVKEQTAIATSGSLLNASMACWRAVVVWSPRIETVRSPACAKCASAASITSMCFAKNTTLPTERCSCAA